MAIVATHEIWQGRRFSEDDKGVREYQRSFRVVTDSSLTSQITVSSIPGLPKRFDPYTDLEGALDLGALAQRIEVRQDDQDPTVWQVEVHYSSKCDWPDLGAEDPRDRPTEIKWGVERYQKAVTKDITGKAIVNSAGEQFDPPPEIDDSRVTLSLVRNEPGFDSALAFSYQDAVNTDVFMGFDPGKLKVSSISAERNFEKGIFFWKVTYEFHGRREGWLLSLLDQGYYELDGGGNKVLIRDKTGAALTSPALLNGAGAKLGVGGVPMVMDFTVYKQLPFDVLGLP